MKPPKHAIIAIILSALLLWTGQVYSASCEDSCDEKSEDEKLNCLNEVRQACESKLSETATQKQTLQNTITYINTQIAYTQSEINKTTFEIERLEEEIVGLTGKINILNTSLKEITKLLLQRISATYKQTKIHPLAIFFTSDGFSEFISRYRYLRAAQVNDRKTLFELEEARANYDVQKNLKEEKQGEVFSLQTELISQRSTQDRQKKEKESLLTITKNDEKRYQSLLQEAEAQARAFSRFVQGEGGASILNNQTVCDGWGCYYNQRDSQWGNMSLGGSGYSVAEYGCLVTAISMIASHQGIDLKPSDIATEPSAFFGALLLDSFDVKGIHVSKTHTSTSILDSELSAGRPVIAGLFSGPDHFIVILRKEGDNYIMHDPFLEGGNNRPLTDKYSLSDISSLRLVQFN